MTHADDGYTLVELLTVVLILGVIATLAIPTYMRQRERAVDAGLESDLRLAAILVEAAVGPDGLYPSALPDVKRSSGSTTLDYQVSASRLRFCLTASNPFAGSHAWLWDSVAGTMVRDGVCTI